MAFFSRLTDIVTCNLTAMLEASADPGAALREIIREMEEGMAGAGRSVAAAQRSLERVQGDIRDQERELARLTDSARKALADGNEMAARSALLLKSETSDVIAGLRQEQQAAEATVVHLTTTLRALEARLSEARRRQAALESPTEDAGESSGGAAATPPQGATGGAVESSRARAVEEELELLRRELDRTS